MGSLLPFGIGALAFLTGCWLCARHHGPMIQEDIRTRAVASLNAAGLKMPPNAVSVDGRDVTLTGPKGWDIVKESTRRRVEDLDGVRVAMVKTVDLAPESSVPARSALPQAEVKRVELNLQSYLRGKVIRFQTAKDAIRPDGKAILDRVAAILEKAPAIPVEISGHTDNTGDAAKNKTLSQRRADSVKRYLVSK